MPNEMFSFEQLDLSGLPDNVSSSKGLRITGGGNLKNHAQNSNQTHSSIGEDGPEVGALEIVGSFSSCQRFDDKEERADEGMFSSSICQPEQQQQLRQFMDFEGLHNLYFDVVCPPFQSCYEDTKKMLEAEPNRSETVELEMERPYAAPLEILTNYGSRLRRLNGKKIKIPHFEVKNTGIVKRKQSTTAILRLAGEKFIHSCNPTRKNKNELSRLSHQNAGSLPGLSEEDNKDVQLVLHLLSGADKVGQKEYHKAKKLLKKCDKLSFDKGNPIQRLVHYFSRALRERIDRENGRCNSKGFGRIFLNYVGSTLSTIDSTVLAFQEAVPICSVCQFAGMQAIIEQVEGARKVHIIDLQIGMGIQFTVLIPALAARSECPVELLKITAVATNCKEAIEATRRRLTSFTQSFNLPFAFNVVMVEDILDLHENLFERDDDEAVAVYSGFFLMLMVGRPDRLESLMEVIRTINPRVMVVSEVEANLNSPVFVNRFTEALFYFGAYFDALEDCLKDDDANRMVMESMFFSQGIKNIVAAEEEERTIRHVKIDVWRAFFARFGMSAVEFSMSSMYQANLILKKFPCGSSFTLEMDGSSLIVGWKGTPTNSLSAWMFD